MRHGIETPTWWIAHENDRVAHGYVETGSVFTSLSSWETFDNETEWRVRLSELGVEIQETENETE
jgi:hypothetical protein